MRGEVKEVRAANVKLSIKKSFRERRKDWDPKVRGEVKGKEVCLFFFFFL